MSLEDLAVTRCGSEINPTVKDKVPFVVQIYFGLGMHLVGLWDFWKPLGLRVLC